MGRAVGEVEGMKVGVDGDVKTNDKKRNYQDEFDAMNNMIIMIK